MFKNENKHPFYKPLWRRIVIVLTIVAWLGFEIYQSNSGLWMAIAAGILAYAVYTFFIAWPKDEEGT